MAGTATILDDAGQRALHGFRRRPESRALHEQRFRAALGPGLRRGTTARGDRPVKRSIVWAAILAGLSTSVAASPEKDAVKALIRTIKQGGDLGATYSGAISEREVASLRRVTKCDATNLMKQDGGYFTVVWDCGSKGALGMKVVLKNGQISSISTMDIGMRPNTGRQ